jgi:hypothetical protein
MQEWHRVRRNVYLFHSPVCKEIQTYYIIISHHTLNLFLKIFLKFRAWKMRTDGRIRTSQAVSGLRRSVAGFPQQLPSFDTKSGNEEIYDGQRVNRAGILLVFRFPLPILVSSIILWSDAAHTRYWQRKWKIKCPRNFTKAPWISFFRGFPQCLHANTGRLPYIRSRPLQYSPSVQYYN